MQPDENRDDADPLSLDLPGRTARKLSLPAKVWIAVALALLVWGIIVFIALSLL